MSKEKQFYFGMTFKCLQLLAHIASLVESLVYTYKTCITTIIIMIVAEKNLSRRDVLVCECAELNGNVSTVRLFCDRQEANS